MPPNAITPEVVAILTYLLPGLVASATFYVLTSHPKPSVFERIVQALIFTALARLLADQLLEVCQSDFTKQTVSGNWRANLSIFIAVLLALIAAYISNNDILHRLLRWLHITKETSHPSVWYSTFARKDPGYVVLHLNNGRRLYGWPEEWPTRSDYGHIRLAEPEWLNERNSPIKSDVADILIPAEQVEMVEFMPGHKTKNGN